jgi:hypothetical protein
MAEALRKPAHRIGVGCRIGDDAAAPRLHDERDRGEEPHGSLSKSHVHPNGSVAYVVSGVVRLQLDDGPVMVHRAGRSLVLRA